MEELKTSRSGLSEEDAKKRLARYGKNEIKKEARTHPLKILLEQFADLLLLILIVATMIAYAIGDVAEASLMLALVLINAGFGFAQQYQAERAVEALRRMTALKVIVIRDGKPIEIDASKVVPGDILELSEGDKIAADCRVIESVNMQTDESTLTGESVPVDKISTIVNASARIHEKANMLFSGTTVVRGHGIAVAVVTGMGSEVGKIAKEIEAPSPPTPLQVYMTSLSKKLSVIILAVCVLVFAVGLLTAKDILELFLITISLAVAAVPEALPIVITLSLAFGAKRMADKKAIMKTLPAVEALGSATVICTDKTGTLTENKMIVKKVYCNGKITGVKQCEEPMLFRIGLVCNNSVLEKLDPTEVALVESAKENGLDYKEYFEYERLQEVPFSSSQKMMITVCEKDEERIAYLKGSPKVVLLKCTKILEHGRVTKLTAEKRKETEEAVDRMAMDALRILALAYKKETKSLDGNYTFVGLQGMFDPPRKEVRGAIHAAANAGIRVVIVTGDHPLTARAVAEQLGIHVDNIITGDEVERLSFDELRWRVESTTIFARAEPSHKNRIVNALRANGEVVAVTGDGVNDAPALKNADIGVAMGARGTDVAKEAADMIVTDDNFATIVSAIEEGRIIYDNIKKSLIYLLATNLAEVLIIVSAVLLLLPLPLTAVQILWINLIGDGFPALAMSLDRAGPGIMKRKPSTGEMLNTDTVLDIIRIGVVMAVTCLVLYMLFLTIDAERAKTAVFMAMVAMEFMVMQTIRQRYGQKLLSNPTLVYSLMMVFYFQLLIIYSPLNYFFNTVPLLLDDWIEIIIALAIVFIANHLLTKALGTEKL
jgi:Ca2+-transporting ATPase